MKINLLALCGLAVLLSSCSTISHTSQTTGVDARVYNLTVADLDVADQKVSKTVDWKWTPLSTVSVESQKKNAEAELCNETGADVVIEPQYEVNRRGLFRGGSVTVTGYPAKYRNFRPMTQEDAEKIALVDGNIAVAVPMIGTSEQTLFTPKKKREKQSFDNAAAPKGHKFLSLIGGLVLASDDHVDTGYQLGLMFGKYGSSWGWYVKGMYLNGKGSDWTERYSDSYTESGLSFTVGVIKTITPRFNAFLGAGYGFNYYSDYYGYGGDFYSANGLATEVGLQWTANRFHVLAGVNFITNFEDCDTNSRVNIDPFIGIGFSF